MRIKLIARCLLFAGLCVCLTCEELWLKNAHTSNSGRIVFTSFRDGNGEIYVMDADGGNPENLTNSPAYGGQPDWSPDGKKIAFVSNRNGGVYQIYVMDADGKNQIRLTDEPVRKAGPDWSPDGRKIAFWVDELFDYIDVMNANGHNRVTLLNDASGPSWSPEGGKIAFLSRRDWHLEIYVIGVGGQGLERVTHDLEAKLNPSFSPDGRRIAYEARPKGFRHIYVVGADGRNRVRLTHNEEHHGRPAWSPDGRIIAYDVADRIGRPGNFHGTIHLMSSNGRYIRQVSDGGNARDFDPDISPLGLAVFPTSKTTTTWGKLKKVGFNRP